jgi:hypothetical protein
VAEATRIPSAYLEALEAESFSVFTSDLHARGFLRNYASFLGLDVDELLASYDELCGKPREKGRSIAPTPVTQPARRRSTCAADALLAIVVFGLVGLVAMSVNQFRNHQEALPTSGPPSTPTVTPMPEFEGTAYTMDVVLDYAQHKLQVRERIDYTNATSETLPNLLLNVHPNHSRGTFQLNEVAVDMDGQTSVPEVFPLDITLRVELPRSLRPDEHVSLLLDYTLNLPKINPAQDFSGGGFGYSKRALSLGNWYPVLAPYRDDKGWYGLTYFPVGDPYVSEVADYDVTITTTQGIVIAGTGKEQVEGNVWHYEAEQARTFAFAASNQFLELSSQAGDVTVHVYHFANNEEAAQVALETAQQSMELFEELYGPYPYSDYRVAETEFAGGMEFSGVTFIGSVFFDEYDGTNRTPLIPLVAHEASHQWFYGLVGSDQLTEPWLDESIAEYSAYLYYERFLPGDADWWWNYAVDQWVPTGKIDSLIYEFRDNRGYVDAVYRRGSEFMRDLREAMGDPAFFAMLQEYQRRYAYRLATSKDFFDLVQEYTTADLVPLEDEYFRQRRLP